MATSNTKRTLPPTVPPFEGTTSDGAISSLKLWNGTLIVLKVDEVVQREVEDDNGKTTLEDRAVKGHIFDGKGGLMDFRIESVRLCRQVGSLTEAMVAKVDNFGRGYLPAPYGKAEESDAMDLFDAYLEAVDS